MSTPQHQLSSLTDAVKRLLDAHAVLKERNHELQQRLEAAEDALTKARHENSKLHNLSTPTPPSPALSAPELDALVEDIDACIALLKT